MVYVRKTIERTLHLNAGLPELKMAHDLRMEMTEAEKALWFELRNKKFMGLKFRRQHAIHFYVADFYCHEKKLIIEVDGKIHLKPEVHDHDINREAELDRFDIQILRFTNDQVLQNMPSVLQKIKTHLNEHPI